MKNLLLLIMAVVVSSTAVAQKEVGGVTLPATQKFKEHTLHLNGAGVREKLWIDLYAAGLYLEKKTSNADEVLNSDKPMAIKLHIVSKLITSDKMVEAVTEGFEKATNGNTAPIQDEINTMLGFFKEDIKKNDVFDLVYVPSKGVIAHKNGKERGVVEGKEFKKALFGIWLSNRPADDDLKKELLSGK
ncbi:Chalcone isomerase-like [Salinimicrobium sediminis]|uniref:Chalcone isomerase-like n=1 Tax=Salinimicrobium sediminis TaxID=1343891 RepID=A0A285XAL7_9FLAO|nr:chalcone isomerase family protein [Salinimicrobium sediminis]SOC81479.1 Chalcone isomerase-like [Salinimicrobium sediminis]